MLDYGILREQGINIFAFVDLYFLFFPKKKRKIVIYNIISGIPSCVFNQPSLLLEYEDTSEMIKKNSRHGWMVGTLRRGTFSFA